MSNFIKLGIGVIVTCGLVYLYQAGKLVAGSFGYQITGYGSPGVNGTTIQLPVQVQFNNPTSVPINIDNVSIQVFFDKNGWVNVATISQPLSIPTGQSTQKINVNIDLSSVVGGNVLNTITFASDIISQKIIAALAQVTVTYAGVTLPMQSFTQNIQVG